MMILQNFVDTVYFLYNTLILRVFCPLLESLFVVLFGQHGLHLLDTLGLTLPFLPGICNSSLLCRVLYTYSLTLSHMLVHNVKTESSECYLGRI